MYCTYYKNAFDKRCGKDCFEASSIRSRAATTKEIFMKKLLKILAVTVAAALIFAILSTADAFLGNPVSYGLVYLNAKQYIQTTYPNTDYQLDRVAYSFKFGDYYAYVQSPTKQDEHFTLVFNG